MLCCFFFFTRAASSWLIQNSEFKRRHVIGGSVREHTSVINSQWEKCQWVVFKYFHILFHKFWVNFYISHTLFVWLCLFFLLLILFPHIRVVGLLHGAWVSKMTQDMLTVIVTKWFLNTNNTEPINKDTKFLLFLFILYLFTYRHQYNNTSKYCILPHWLNSPLKTVFV